MPKKFFNFSFSKKFLSAFILLINAFVWFFITSIKIIPIILGPDNPSEIMVWSVYYLSIIISGLFGSILSNRFNRQNFIFSWIILGVAVSPLPIFFNNFTTPNMLIGAILLGTSLGLGMPSCLAYFTDCTTIENRGHSSGITFLITNIIAGLLIISVRGLIDLSTILVIFTIWRATALITFFLKDEKQIVFDNKKNPSLVSVIQDKTFLLFFVAWLMFCLVDRFETPIQEFYFEDSYNIIYSVGPLVGSIAALAGGIFVDRIGRKKILIATFVAMGVSYTISGISPTNEIGSPGLNLINFTSLSILSVSGGVMFVLFILVLWGDLTKFVRSEKYFAIGIAPFFITNILRVLSKTYLPEEIGLASAFSLAAFFLFLAVIPLLYAPETLPEKKMELRRLRSFADEAKKIREKYENKNLA